jgi:hypothetical protein
LGYRSERAEVRGGAELPTHRAGPRTRSRVFCVIGPPVRALEETSRQLAWLALASGAADPNPGADVFAPLVVNRIGLISGRPSRSSKGVSTYFRVGQGMRLSGWGHPRRAIITRQAIDSGGKDRGGFRIRKARMELEDARWLAAVWLAQLSQLAVNNPSNGWISEGVVSQGRHHRVDGYCVSECRPL